MWWSFNHQNKSYYRYLIYKLERAKEKIKKSYFEAAHCLKKDGESAVALSEKAKNMEVWLGAHNLTKDEEDGRKRVAVESIKVHESWLKNPEFFNDDIAIIQFEKPIKYSPFIRPVCNAISEQSSINQGVIVGWGNYDSYERTSEIPRKIKLPILNNQECFKREEVLAKIKWDESFCAGGDDIAVCKGDSGSGFYIKDNERFFLRGIVSSSVNRDCGNTKVALYTDVTHYLSFAYGQTKLGRRMSFAHSDNLIAECRNPT